jgi:hypothetical protein
MQRVKIYNDLLHLTGEWMNADMLNRGTEDRPLSLFMGGGANVPSAPLCIRHWIQWPKENRQKGKQRSTKHYTLREETLSLNNNYII